MALGNMSSTKDMCDNDVCGKPGRTRGLQGHIKRYENHSMRERIWIEQRLEALTFKQWAVGDLDTSRHDTT